MAQICKAKTNSGAPCSAWALTGEEFCYIHSPSRSAERAEARRRGGFNRRTAHAGDSSSLPKAIRTSQDIFQLLDFTLAETAVLDNGIGRTRALIALAECYLHALETGDFELRLARLEVIYANRQTTR